MLGKLRALVGLIFGRAPDTSTARGRSRDRYRRAGLTSLAGVAAKGVAALTSLAIYPLAIGYLGPDRFGMWRALTSAVLFLAFADLGLGIGLQNALTQCHGVNDRKSPRHLISSAYLFLTCLFLGLTAFAVLVVPHLPVDRLIKTATPEARAELVPTVQAVLIAFGFGLPTSLIRRTYMAYQRGYWVNIWLLVGRVAAFGGVVCCVLAGLGVPYLAAAYMGLPYVVMLLGGIRLFSREPFIRPSPRAVRWRSVWRLTSIAWVALLAQIASIVIKVGVPLVIANRLSTEAVTPFATSRAPLLPGLMILTALVVPLWPAYGEAAGRGDLAWVRRTFRRSVWLGLLVQVPLCVMMLTFGSVIVNLLSQGEVDADWMLIAGLSFWFVCFSINRCAAVALNGLNHMIGQATFGLGFGLLGLVVAYLLAPEHGLVAVVWSVALVAVLPRTVGLHLELQWVMRKLGRERNASPAPETEGKSPGAANAETMSAD